MIKYFLAHSLILGIAIIVIVIPQVNITEYVQSTINSKFVVFAYSCFALLGIFLIYVMTSRFQVISVSKLDIALFLLVLFITINRYFMRTEIGFSIRYMELVGLSFIYIVVRSLSSKNYIWLLLAIVVSGSFQAIYGNLQLLGYYSSNHSGFKMTGSFFNPGPYAGFLVSVWGIALGMYLFKEELIAQVQSQLIKNSKVLEELIKYAFEYIPLIGIVSIAIILPAIQSRAAWLAAIFSSIILSEFRYNILGSFIKKTSKIKRIVIGILSIIILSVGLYGVYNFKKGSSEGRMFIWKVTAEMIQENPVFGVGFDRFKAHYMDTQANYFVKNGETPEAMIADNTYYAFNEWIQYISENGLVGLLFLALVLAGVFSIVSRKENKHLSMVLKVSLLAIGVFACFSYPMQILPVKLMLVLLLAFLSGFDIRKYRIKEMRQSWNSNIVLILKPLLLIIGFAGIVKGVEFTSYMKQGFKTWKNASTAYQYRDYKGAIQEFKKCYPMFKMDGEFLMKYGKVLSMSNEHNRAIQILEKSKRQLNTTIIETALGDSYKSTKQYNNAEIAYQHAADMIPSRFYPNYLLAILYDETGQKGKAIKKATEILNKEVRIQSTAIKEIQTEMNEIIKKYNKTSG